MPEDELWKMKCSVLNVHKLNQIMWRTQTRNLSNLLHQQDSQIFRKSRLFCPRMYFEQIVSFYANTKSFHFFCEKSSRNLANFTDKVIFCAKYWKYFHKCHLWLLRQIPRLVKVGERWHSLETFESESLESSQKCFSYVDSCRNSC